MELWMLSESSLTYTHPHTNPHTWFPKPHTVISFHYYSHTFLFTSSHFSMPCQCFQTRILPSQLMAVWSPVATNPDLTTQPDTTTGPLLISNAKPESFKSFWTVPLMSKQPILTTVACMTYIFAIMWNYC